MEEEEEEKKEEEGEEKEIEEEKEEEGEEDAGEGMGMGKEREEGEAEAREVVEWRSWGGVVELYNAHIELHRASIVTCRRRIGWQMFTRVHPRSRHAAYCY